MSKIQKLEEDLDNDKIDLSQFHPVAMKHADVDEAGNIIAISF